VRTNKTTCYNSFIRGFLIFLFSFQFIFQQAYNQYPELTSILKDNDIKKIRKAGEEKQEADELVREASELNLEILSLQDNFELDEKTVQKRIDKLEKNVNKKLSEAAPKYEKANEIRYKLYSSYSRQFHDDNKDKQGQYINERLVEEQAHEMMHQASQERKRAGRIDNEDARLEALSEAYNMENIALDKFISVLAVYYGQSSSIADTDYRQDPRGDEEASDQITYPEPVDEQGSYDVSAGIQQPSGETGTMQLNEHQLDVYRGYVDNNDIPPPVIINRNGVGDLDTFNRDEIAEMWHAYLADSLYAKYDQAGYALDEAGEEKLSPQTEEESITEVTQPPEVREDVDERIAVVDEDIRDTIIVPADEDVIYRVQIAEDQSKLSQNALRRIYYGNKNVEMINEDGIYKYSIGDFDTYAEADQFRSRSGVDNAFVVAYREGTRFVPGTTTGDTDETVFQPAVSTDYPSGLVFYVQIAAGRSPVFKDQLNRIYQGKYPIEMVTEGGWYKYRIGGVRLFSDAEVILGKTDVNRRFVVAYEDGQKLNLADAMRKSRSIESQVRTRGRGVLDEIFFSVQIAASRFMISKNDLKDIYNGTEPVTLVIEDNWYKYRLKTGTSYDRARQVKQTCNVPGVFIVAYKRGLKIQLDRAIQESKQ